MKTITLTLLLTILSVGVFAQEFEVPKDYKFQTAKDYAPYEKDIINCVTWLLNTPLTEQPDKRKESNAFLLKWLTGSPTIKIEIKGEIVTFMDTPELLMLFMGGWAKYSLESGDLNNKVKGNMAGIEAVIEFYTKNKEALSKNKNVEKYIKMKEKGTLKEFIEKNA
jgi:hypothetical protein